MSKCPGTNLNLMGATYEVLRIGNMERSVLKSAQVPLYIIHINWRNIIVGVKLSMSLPRTMNFSMGSFLLWSLLFPRLPRAMMQQRESTNCVHLNLWPSNFDSFSFDGVLFYRYDSSDEEDKRDILVFHCEFSSKRGPDYCTKLRTKDRNVNKDVYPGLHYPEVHLYSECKIVKTKICTFSRSICCTRATRSSGRTTPTCARGDTQRWTIPSFRTTCAHAGCLNKKSLIVVSKQCPGLFIRYSFAQGQE